MKALSNMNYCYWSYYLVYGRLFSLLKLQSLSGDSHCTYTSFLPHSNLYHAKSIVGTQ